VPTSTNPGIANPLPQQLVTSVTANDGRGGQYRTEYSYYDARLLPGTAPNRRNLGFSWIEIRDAATGSRARNEYIQTPGREGSVWIASVYGGDGNLMSRTYYDYEYVTPSAGTELVREKSKATQVFEAGVLAFAQATSTSGFDAYGNATVKMQIASNLRPSRRPRRTPTTPRVILGDPRSRRRATARRSDG
jgi:hypothetical protein